MSKPTNLHHLFSIILSFTISSSLAQKSVETDDLETSSFKCWNPVTQNLGSIQTTYYLTESQNFYESLIELTSSTHFRICICSARTCIKKQCRRGEVFDLTSRECQNATTAFRKANGYNDQRPLPEDFKKDASTFYGLHCRQCPIYMFLIFPDYPDVVFSIRENNVLKTTPEHISSFDNEGRITYELETTCFGGIPEGRFLIPAQEIITVCKTPIDLGNRTDQQSAEPTTYEAVKIISIPFLLVIVLAHAFIPELRKQHGINSTCYVVALFIAYTFSGIEVVIGDSPTGPTFCFIRGIAAVFLYLPAYFWLNIMCIEIWWKFSEFRCPWRFRGSPKIQALQKHVIWQSLGWGGPIFLIWTFLTLNIFPLTTDYVIKPDLGKEKCFIRINTAIVEDVTIPGNEIILWLLFFAPEGILLFVNIILLIRVGIKICATRRENQMINEDENQIDYEENKQRYLLYLELFIIITVHLVILFINTVRHDPTPPWLLNSVNISFGLIGVYIFLIYSFRPKFLKLIKLRLFPPRLEEHEQRKNGNTPTNRPKGKSSEMELLYIEGCSKTPDKNCDNEDNNSPYY